jgi:hypothetical protein
VPAGEDGDRIPSGEGEQMNKFCVTFGAFFSGVAFEWFCWRLYWHMDAFASVLAVIGATSFLVLSIFWDEVN